MTHKIDVKLPTKWSEVTVAQYQKLWKVYESETEAYQAVRRSIELLGGLEHGALEQARWQDIESAHATLSWLMSDPDALTMKMPLQNTVNLNGVRYGFIPNWSMVTVGEFADLETHTQAGMFDRMEKVLSILYRPIYLEKGDSYEIELYTVSPDRQKAMLEMPMDVAIGAVLFFCNIEKALVINMEAYLANPKKILNLHRSIRSGVGTQLSMN